MRGTTQSFWVTTLKQKAKFKCKLLLKKIDPFFSYIYIICILRSCRNTRRDTMRISKSACNMLKETRMAAFIRRATGKCIRKRSMNVQVFNPKIREGVTEWMIISNELHVSPRPLRRRWFSTHSKTTGHSYPNKFHGEHAPPLFVNFNYSSPAHLSYFSATYLDRYEEENCYYNKRRCTLWPFEPFVAKGCPTMTEFLHALERRKSTDISQISLPSRTQFSQQINSVPSREILTNCKQAIIASHSATERNLEGVSVQEILPKWSESIAKFCAISMLISRFSPNYRASPV